MPAHSLTFDLADEHHGFLAIFSNFSSHRAAGAISVTARQVPNNPPGLITAASLRRAKTTQWARSPAHSFDQNNADENTSVAARRSHRVTLSRFFSAYSPLSDHAVRRRRCHCCSDFVRSDSGHVKYAESVLYLHFNAGAVTHSVDNSAELATNGFSPHIEHR
jgi:hypothetical protein